MVLEGAELCSVAVVPRNDSAESLFAFNFTFNRGCEINVKNLVANFLALMGLCEVVMR